MLTLARMFFIFICCTTTNLKAKQEWLPIDLPTVPELSKMVDNWNTERHYSVVEGDDIQLTFRGVTYFLVKLTTGGFNDQAWVPGEDARIISILAVNLNQVFVNFVHPSGSFSLQTRGKCRIPGFPVGKWQGVGIPPMECWIEDPRSGPR